VREKEKEDEIERERENDRERRDQLVTEEREACLILMMVLEERMQHNF